MGTAKALYPDEPRIEAYCWGRCKRTRGFNFYMRGGERNFCCNVCLAPWVDYLDDQRKEDGNGKAR